MSYDFVKADKIAFAYTIKDNRKVSNIERRQTYDKWFNKCRVWSIPIEYQCEEEDKQGRLHIHGIVYLNKGFYRKKLCMPNLHLKLVEMYNKQGWEQYIHKDLLDTTSIHDITPDEYDPQEDQSIFKTNLSTL